MLPLLPPQSPFLEVVDSRQSAEAISLVLNPPLGIIMAQIKITWKKSCIGHPGSQKRIIQSLGLHRLNQTVIHADTPTIRGMVAKVPHLVFIEAVQ